MNKAKANKPKDIFDTACVRVRRGKGQKLAGSNDDPYLLVRCAEDAVERILDINREFSRTLIFANIEISKLIKARTEYKLGHIICVDHTSHPNGLDLVCRETALPFAPHSFDLVINCLSLHTVNNVQHALMEIKTLLKPDGVFIGALFGGETLGALRHALYETEDTLYNRVTPRVSPMISLQQAAKLLQSSGFTMPVSDRDLVQTHYASLSSLFYDLRRMGETNTLLGKTNTPVSKRFFEMLTHIYTRDHANNAGKLIVKFDILWLTGWVHHKDQPKPLKPGSATTRLSDVLGVPESKL